MDRNCCQVLPGVTIDADSVVEVEAVVTHDVTRQPLWRVCQRLSLGGCSRAKRVGQIRGRHTPCPGIGRTEWSK